MLQEIQEKVEGLSLNEKEEPVNARDPEVDWLHNAVLGKKLKVVLSDLREIIGTLQCVDHLANIVLTNTTEHLNSEITRNLGNVIVPSKGIKQVYLSTNN